MSSTNNDTLLLAGASGYLGGLVAAGLLAETQSRLVAPLRTTTSRETVIDKIKSELNGQSKEIDFDRLITIDLPANDQMQTLLPTMQKFDVKEIIHCAGSVDYFDAARLKEVNIDLTNELVSLGKKQQVEKFIYLSTAFSSGYKNDLITETIHGEPEADPTEYTKSKRQAESLVYNSSLPFLIIRPSVVIGDSRDGHYPGKPYGLYQLWAAFERFLCDRYRSTLHFIAPAVKLQLVHQDAFQAGFMAARQQLPANSIIHLTSNHETLPSVREVNELWCRLCTKANKVYYYDRFEEVPLEDLDRRTKMWLEFTGVNNDIAAAPWKFQNTALDKLRANGLKFKDATLDTIRICQDRFVSLSERIKTFLTKSE